MSIQILQPPHWERPKGYSAGVVGSGRQVLVSGQIGCNERLEISSDLLCDQVRLALANVVTVLAEANARAEHIARLTWYIVDRHEYHAQLKEIGAAYRDVIGRHYPAMAVVQVAALLEERAKVEIEALALLP
jgi:enamine deaminase RidA (YjgF/YER057c/UK114 family)